jgi:hypothetical protein
MSHCFIVTFPLLNSSIHDILEAGTLAATQFTCARSPAEIVNVDPDILNSITGGSEI